MNRAARARHRRMIVSLLVVVPALFVGGLLARRLPPPMSDLPVALVAPEPLLRELTDGAPLDWDGVNLPSRIGRAGDGSFVVVLHAFDPPRRPDVLLYWSVREVRIGEALPDDARLLGAYPGTGSSLFRLPSGAARGGSLLLYSLPHQELFAVAALPSTEG